MLVTAKDIIRDVKKSLGVKLSVGGVRTFASMLGYGVHNVNGEECYLDALCSAIKNKLGSYSKPSVKTSQSGVNASNRGDYYAYNGERYNIDYPFEVNDGIISRAVMEAVNELDLYHGSSADFDKFDLAYLSSGWGQQAYGYGVYLTNSTECAKEYSKGGLIYTVKVPNRPYLSYTRISRDAAYKIARDFYKWYLENDEYGREAYKGCEKEFWNEECKYLCDCQDGGDIYGTIASILGSDKETSDFLYKEGYKGIKWVDVTSDGTRNTNYVIFNPKDIKILKKEKV